ncbi:SGNH/GDSL hydrolase family protein [Mucilaginibacter gotjawali]|uniref:Lysophospholipase L1-like esterase n=1 Tax=Mucilaginibacter gotjawali TaxID=1550579 RepID=A0A839SBQ0_9SPHI|nr:GDSL-type esterase/lipase family protein [Mucilaginibacter gotjawali]MBB3054754.1 lysophospholipase L1-like esterase [Mucilaginibacter gotjawali]
MFKINLTKAFLLTVLTGAICVYSSSAQTVKQNLNIVFIGNSITHGANLDDPLDDAPPVIATAYLRKQANIRTVNYSNQGYSGFTTVDFLPSTGTAFKKVEVAAAAFEDKKAQLIFSIKLGTNDSAIQGPNGSPVAPGAYQQNLKTIADNLLKEFPGCIIIFQHPIWYSPNTYNGAKYLQEGLSRLQSYIPLIDQLVADYAKTQPKQVFVGDTDAFGYFKKNYLTDLTPEDGHQGTFYLHPNKKGAAALGTFWAKAILKVLKQR